MSFPVELIKLTLASLKVRELPKSDCIVIHLPRHCQYRLRSLTDISRSMDPCDGVLFFCMIVTLVNQAVDQLTLTTRR